jgi:hypothetical protein
MKTVANVIWAIIYENTKDALLLFAVILAAMAALYVLQHIGGFLAHPAIGW